MTPIWRFFGADEPNYAYMKDGKKLLTELGKIGAPQVYFRSHHLLTSGDGAYALKWGSTSAYKEDASGAFSCFTDWTINDRIFDTYLERGGQNPYVQIGFMPKALLSHPEKLSGNNPPVDKRAPADAGQSYPPKDYAKWGELAHQWATHCVEKYGSAEVEKWYWEVWNEPNISYWHASPADYFKLYDYAVDGVRRALPSARVGGPETAGGAGGGFLRVSFWNITFRNGTQLRVAGKIGFPWTSFHFTRRARRSSPMATFAWAWQISSGTSTARLVVIASAFPEFKKLPIVIGESDPEGCAACREPRDAYRNSTMYSSYTAASFSREYELAQKYGVNLEGALTWAFEFENQPPFAGFRQLASAGIDLPVLNVFRMFGKMSGQRIAVESSAGLDAQKILASGVRGDPDVSALASLDKNKLAVLVWHYHDDDVTGPDADVALALDNLPAANGGATVTRYVIDADHSDSYAAWRRMGSPQPPSEQQYSELERAGQLAMLGQPGSLSVENGKATVKFTLSRQAVTLLIVEWK